jgi:hypothetical protein
VTTFGNPQGPRQHPGHLHDSVCHVVGCPEGMFKGEDPIAPVVKTYGELSAEINTEDEDFKVFCRGWDAAVRCHSIAAHERNERRDLDSSTYSMAQEAQLWGFYTGQISIPK